MEYKSFDLEARNRRYILIFWGLSELVGEGGFEPIIHKFLAEHLLLDIDNIYIQRAHRLGKPNPPQRRWVQKMAKCATKLAQFLARRRDVGKVNVALTNVKDTSIEMNLAKEGLVYFEASTLCPKEGQMCYKASTGGPKRVRCTLRQKREAEEGRVYFEARTGGPNVKCTYQKVQNGQV